MYFILLFNMSAIGDGGTSEMKYRMRPHYRIYITKRFGGTGKLNIRYINTT